MKIRSYILKSLGRQASGSANTLQDYDEYRMKSRDVIVCMVEGMMILALISYVFYRSPIAFLVLIPALVPFIDYKRKQKIEKRKKEINLNGLDYYNYVYMNKQEMDLLLNNATVNETYFFREESQFLFLKNKVLVCFRWPTIMRLIMVRRPVLRQKTC